MRAATGVLALLLLLPACASVRESSDRVPLSGERYDGYARRPLRARIVSSSNLGVQLNRPAYAAVFEMIPGRGIGLVYPYSGSSSGYLSSGFSSLWTQTSLYRTAYLDDPFGYSSQGPRYYYLIASDEPLRVGQFLQSPVALRSTLGFQSFASWNPYSMMEDLADRVLPNVPDANWDSDLYVVWPTSRQSRGMSTQLVAVRCQGGRTFYVPSVYLGQVCANRVGRPGSGRTRPAREEPAGRGARPARPNDDAADRASRQIARRELERPERPQREADTEARAERPARGERARRESGAETRAERPEAQRPERAERPQARPEPRPEVQRPERPAPRSEPRTESRRPEREPS